MPDCITTRFGTLTLTCALPCCIVMDRTVVLLTSCDSYTTDMAHVAEAVAAGHATFDIDPDGYDTIRLHFAGVTLTTRGAVQQRRDLVVVAVGLDRWVPGSWMGNLYLFDDRLRVDVVDVPVRA